MRNNTNPGPTDSDQDTALLVIDPEQLIPAPIRDALLAQYPACVISDHINEINGSDPGVVIVALDPKPAKALSLITDIRLFLPLHQCITIIPAMDTDLVLELMRHGANDCLDFTCSQEKLLAAIRYHFDMLDKHNRARVSENPNPVSRDYSILRQREALYRSLFELSDDANMTLNPDGFIDCNQATLRMFGYATKEEFLGRHPSEISPDFQPDGRDSRSAADERMATATEQGRDFFEWTHKRANGTSFPATVLLTRITFDNQTFLQAIVRDITDYKQFEQEIMEARDEAEYANNAKSDFLARMSHELRTPLNAILGFSQLLQLDKTIMTDGQRENINHIVSAGKHLLRLIDEILDIVRADTGAIDINPVNISLRHALSQAMILMKPLAAKNNIRLEHSVPDNLYVVADESRLKQVMVNLISNAIKYNRSEGSVRIVARPTGNNMVRLSITDTGIGIRPEDHKTLFEPFRRADVSAATPDGTGIGLTISRKLVNLMHGKIGFESEFNKGSTFWIEFPASNPEPEQESPGMDTATILSEPENSCQVTVLYIEDNKSSRALVQQLFARTTGFVYVGAGDGKQGLRLAREHKPDVILLDINLPGMSGFEVLENLRNEPETDAIPVIALTANATDKQVEAGKDAGFEEYITKPFSLDKLFRVLKKYNIAGIQS